MAGQSCFSLIRTSTGTGPEAPSPEVVRLGRSPTGAPGVRGRLCGWQSPGPWGCCSDNILSLRQLRGRLLQYLLNNQPRNSIVQDKK